MGYTEDLLEQLRQSWSVLSKTKCSGTVAIVDLVGSTKFKSTYRSPDIWLERLDNFLTVVMSVKKEILSQTFTKVLGDGILLFSKDDQVKPEQFVVFAETLAEKIKLLNSTNLRYSSEEFTIEFTLALDYGPDIFLLHGGDPQGIVVDRAFRISSYLTPNMIGASSKFHNHLKEIEYKDKFIWAGKAYLKGISDDWQEIYALKTIKNFSTQLSDEQRKKGALKDIWEMGDSDKPIWVVTGAIQDEDTSTYSIQHGDINALIEIVHILSKVYPDRSIEIVTSDKYLERNNSSLDNDIISVGGPYYNSVSRRVLQRENLPIRFELDPLKLNEYEDAFLIFQGEDGTETLYNTERIGCHIATDVAVFIKMKNPFTAERYCYLIMGNQTQGVNAAARIFGISTPFLNHNYEYFKSKLGISENNTGLGIVAKSRVIKSYVEPIEIDDSNLLKTFTLPLSYNVIVKQKAPTEEER